jgi:hypothetical protein
MQSVGDAWQRASRASTLASPEYAPSRTGNVPVVVLFRLQPSPALHPAIRLPPSKSSGATEMMRRKSARSEEWSITASRQAKRLESSARPRHAANVERVIGISEPSNRALQRTALARRR